MAKQLLDNFAARADLTITLASLASSITGVGRQSSIVDNTVTRYTSVDVVIQVKTTATTTANSVISVYLIRSDGHAATPRRDDNAGPVDAAITILNADFLGTLTTGTITTAQTLPKIFHVLDLGPKWAIAIVNSTGTALDATAGNHYAGFIGRNRSVG